MALKPQIQTPRFYINTNQYYKLTGFISRMKMAQMMSTELWAFNGGLNPLKYEKIGNMHPNDYHFISLANGLMFRDEYEEAISLNGIGDSSTNERFWYLPQLTGYDSHDSYWVANPHFEYEYIAVLGHNFGTAGFGMKICEHGHDALLSNTSNSIEVLDDSRFKSIINFPNATSPKTPYDGFSIADIREYQSSMYVGGTQENPQAYNRNEMLSIRVENQVATSYTNTLSPIDVKVGSLMMGQIWDFPKDCDIHIRLEHEYSTTTKTASNGRRYSFSQPTYNDLWIGEMAPWTLREPITPLVMEEINYPIYAGATHHNNNQKLYDGYASPIQYDGANHVSGTAPASMRPLDTMLGRQRQGARVWKMTFTHLKGQDLFPTNLSTNVVGRGEAQGDTIDGSDYTTPENAINWSNTEQNSANIVNQKYDYHAQKCFTNTVVEKTMNGAIPFMFQPDSNDYTPSGFCWATIDSNPKFTQIAPNLWDMNITIREIL